MTTIETSTQAAEALRPIAGDFAFLVFARGIMLVRVGVHGRYGGLRRWNGDRLVCLKLMPPCDVVFVSCATLFSSARPLGH